ncbi:hypothetical protein AMK21_13155 [Streptomyces sp. CB00316]|nr:hypothetical protein AMK21_13155 [Streptomyces sp. CB00316]
MDLFVSEIRSELLMAGYELRHLRPHCTILDILQMPRLLDYLLWEVVSYFLAQMLSERVNDLEELRQPLVCRNITERGRARVKFLVSNVRKKCYVLLDLINAESVHYECQSASSQRCGDGARALRTDVDPSSTQGAVSFVRCKEDRGHPC